MERKIGEIFEYNGEWYQCVESDSCGECSLFTTECGSGTKSDLADKVFGQCSKVRRSDNKHAIFKKLEKVGEPYSNADKLYQLYTLPMNIEKLPSRTKGINLVRFDMVEIQIKQNKENMEEKKLNLKSFDLDAAKQGKPVCTRDRRKARIICFDRIDSTGCNLSIVALIQCEGTEVLQLYHDDGKCDVKADLDLMMLPEKKEGWAKVRKDINLYDTKEEADRKMIGNDEYVTAKVCWEE